MLICLESRLKLRAKFLDKLRYSGSIGENEEERGTFPFYSWKPFSTERKDLGRCNAENIYWGGEIYKSKEKRFWSIHHKFKKLDFLILKILLH